MSVHLKIDEGALGQRAQNIPERVVASDVLAPKDGILNFDPGRRRARGSATLPRREAPSQP